jgi:hydroxymethylpyrimidine pyrophosphatase-like HAD family hydrolase
VTWETAPLFPAIAADYDGTLAVQDRIPPAGIDALTRARSAGIKLILASGRTLFELTRVCERLDLFDAVVAENGGVLYFPRDQAMREEGPAPSPRLLEELDRRGVPYQAGRVVVATLHEFRQPTLAAVQAAEVTVDVVSNRAALMLLPPLISKGSGVTSALFALDVAPRDVLAIGDADNDLPLFDACGWSACPEDALVDVKRCVDWILPGGAGDGVARVIAERILAGKLPPPRRGQHFVHLGWATATGDAVEIPARGVNVLVQGESLCGKSCLVGGLVERLAATHETVCVIDPEGDYGVLGGLPGARAIRVRREDDWGEVVDGLRSSTPVVADLSAVHAPAQAALALAGLARLRRSRTHSGLPHWIVVDEAHHLLAGRDLAAADLALDTQGVCDRRLRCRANDGARGSRGPRGRPSRPRRRRRSCRSCRSRPRRRRVHADPRLCAARHVQAASTRDSPRPPSHEVSRPRGRAAPSLPSPRAGRRRHHQRGHARGAGGGPRPDAGRDGGAPRRPR